MPTKTLIPFLRRFSSFALLGALTTIAIAWLCILWGPDLPESLHPLADDIFLSDKVSFVGKQNIRSFDYRFDYGFGWAHFYTYNGTETVPSHHLAGFPNLALYSSAHIIYQVPGVGGYPKRWQLPPSEILSRGLNTSDLPSFLLVQKERRLPLLPLWPGFLLNTLLYALIFFMLDYYLHPVAKFRRWKLSHQNGFPVQTTKPESTTSPNSD